MSDSEQHTTAERLDALERHLALVEVDIGVRADGTVARIFERLVQLEAFAAGVLSAGEVEARINALRTSLVGVEPVDTARIVALASVPAELSVLEAPRSDLADVPVRWSWLSHFASSPLHARHAALYGKEPTAAMKLGTAGHVVTFDEPHDVFRTVNPKTGKVWNRNSKAWDEFEADCEDRAVTPLTIAEYDKARRIRDALRSHRDAAPLLFGEGVVREQPIHWVRHGRACSSRPDARKPGEWIADLKTCRTARPDRFMKAAQWAGYTGQLVFYSEADAFEANRNPASLASQMLPLYIVAVEPFPPYAVTVFELDETAKEHGRRAVATAWGQLEACEAVNAWPGYAEGVVPFVIEANGDDQANLDDLDPPDPEDAQEEY